MTTSPPNLMHHGIAVRCALRRVGWRVGRRNDTELGELCRIFSRPSQGILEFVHHLLQRRLVVAATGTTGCTASNHLAELVGQQALARGSAHQSILSC